jgi:IS30 family transposase
MSDTSDLPRLAELISSTTAARGVDMYAVKECGLSAAEWAEMTDRARSTVARNVRRGFEHSTD